jgi:hypothetical protein
MHADKTKSVFDFVFVLSALIGVHRRPDRFAFLPVELELAQTFPAAVLAADRARDGLVEHPTVEIADGLEQGIGHHARYGRRILFTTRYRWAHEFPPKNAGTY